MPKKPGPKFEKTPASQAETRQSAEELRAELDEIGAELDGTINELKSIAVEAEKISRLAEAGKTSQEDAEKLESLSERIEELKGVKQELEQRIETIRAETAVRQAEPVEKELQEQEPGAEEKEEKERNGSAIEDSTSFQDLYNALDALGEIKGATETYASKDLKRMIEQVRKGDLTIAHITRSEGLRGKVIELLEQERKEEAEPWPHGFVLGQRVKVKRSERSGGAVEWWAVAGYDPETDSFSVVQIDGGRGAKNPSPDALKDWQELEITEEPEVRPGRSRPGAGAREPVVPFQEFPMRSDVKVELDDGRIVAGKVMGHDPRTGLMKVIAEGQEREVSLDALKEARDLPLSARPAPRRADRQRAGVETREPIKVRQEESAPWGRFERAEERSQYQEYMGDCILGTNQKRAVDKILEQRIAQLRIEFARQWHSENEDEIKAKGRLLPIDRRNDGYYYRIAEELGGFRELKTSDSYEERRLQIEGLYAVRQEIDEKEFLGLDVQYLTLNALNEEAIRVWELSQSKDSSKTERKAQREKLIEVFELRKAIASGIMGHDIKEMTKEELRKQMRGSGGVIKRFNAWLGPDEKDINQRIEQEMGILGRMSPDQIVERFEELRSRVVAEFVVKEQKKEKRTKEEMQAIEAQFERTGHDPLEFITDVLNRENKSFEVLTGNAGDDAEAIEDFLAGYDIEVPPEKLIAFDKKRGKGQMKYADAVKIQKGFLWYLFDLVFSLYKE